MSKLTDVLIDSIIWKLDNILDDLEMLEFLYEEALRYKTLDL